MKAHKAKQIIIPRVKRKPAMNIPKTKEIANLSMHTIGYPLPHGFKKQQFSVLKIDMASFSTARAEIMSKVVWELL